MREFVHILRSWAHFFPESLVNIGGVLRSDRHLLVCKVDGFFVQPFDVKERYDVGAMHPDKDLRRQGLFQVIHAGIHQLRLLCRDDPHVIAFGDKVPDIGHPESKRGFCPTQSLCASPPTVCVPGGFSERKKTAPNHRERRSSPCPL